MNGNGFSSQVSVLGALLTGAPPQNLRRTCANVVRELLGFVPSELATRCELTQEALERSMSAALDLNKAFGRPQSDPITRVFISTYRQRSDDDDEAIREIRCLFDEDGTQGAMRELFSLLATQIEGLDFMESCNSGYVPQTLVWLKRLYPGGEICDLEQIFVLGDRKPVLNELEQLPAKAAFLLSKAENKSEAFDKEVRILRYLALRHLSRVILLDAIDEESESLYSRLLTGCPGSIEYGPLACLLEHDIDQEHLDIATAHYDTIPPEYFVEFFVDLFLRRPENNDEGGASSSATGPATASPLDGKLQRQVLKALARHDPWWCSTLDKYMACWYIRASCLKSFYRSILHPLKPKLRLLFMWGRVKDLFPVPAREALESEPDKNKRKRSKEMSRLLVKNFLPKAARVAGSYLTRRDLLNDSGPESLAALSCVGLRPGTTEFNTLYWHFMEHLVTDRDIRKFQDEIRCLLE